VLIFINPPLLSYIVLSVNSNTNFYKAHWVWKPRSWLLFCVYLSWLLRADYHLSIINKVQLPMRVSEPQFDCETVVWCQFLLREIVLIHCSYLPTFLTIFLTYYYHGIIGSVLRPMPRTSLLTHGKASTSCQRHVPGSFMVFGSL